MTCDLATQLREGTKQSHTLAENTAFMKCFLKGIVEREPLRKLFADLYFVYSTLEAELERHIEHPAVGAIYFPELNRKEKLEQDLAYFYGEDWHDLIHASAAGKTYVARIKEISNNEPELLIAHAYVRYMGDLSGGQALKNIIRSALKLPSDRSINFYEFNAISTVEARREFKNKYRDALDRLPIDKTTVARIVEEANYAFALNRDVVHELENEVKAAIGIHVFELLTRQDIPGSTERAPGKPAVELVAVE
ncbi:heme oxygenase (biliverdin-producing) [Oscillatoria sp. FACHB-1406]|uniref:biliverdin-producing heme oxygenase n=1 Tax=Oscillatoria sp. FACHB-1406 TaxID=2692846 RepID=UPI001687A055|nr:heme oxygenase (biliverdin-producing) [Oscillatoria sp. FACHB-1406]MBD2578252.1 heme oxygenase (biliverdin-producing) [Oscillatoria sp. FACHB-1406]